MTIDEYRKRRAELFAHESQFRRQCHVCFQPEVQCYCSEIRPFDPKIIFAILIHPIEARRRIATGRMSHLCLKNSHLIVGEDYSNDSTVNRLIQDPRNHSVMLYPGARSVDLTPLAAEERSDLFPSHKNLVVFVIDGTWSKARKTVRMSQNLLGLPRIGFTPPAPSRFRVRKQPSSRCYSTIEAIHYTIELIGESRGFQSHLRAHDGLLEVFDRMVERQLVFVRYRTCAS